MDNKYSVQDIVKFINGKMNDGESGKFTEAVANDAELANEVEEQRKLQRLVQIATLKGKLDNIHNDYNSDETNAVTIKRKSYALWGWAAVAAAIAGIAIFLLFYKSGTPPNEKLFAKYYKDDVGSPSLMGGNASAFDDAMVYYKSGDYQAAGTKFSQLLSAKPQNDTLKYYDALSQISLKNENEALKLLSSVSQKDTGDLYIKSQWYKALVLIHQKKTDEAIVILEKVKASDSPVYKSKASDILAELKKQSD